MRARAVLSAVAVAVVLGSTLAAADELARRQARNVQVDVRIDCLAGRGVSFSLTPWEITVMPGDSISWKLDPQSNVDSMDIIEARPGRGWPFARKPPYKSRRSRANGARALDANQRGGRYRYAVRAICVRSESPLEVDTVLIDPEMIIIRGGGN
jgi:hypothetical protein